MYKNCKNIFNLSFDEGKIMVLFFFLQSQSTIPNQYRSLYGTIFTEAEIGLKSSWKRHLKSPGLVPQFLGKKIQVQRSEINDLPKVIQLRDRSGLESTNMLLPHMLCFLQFWLQIFTKVTEVEKKVY